MRRDSFFRCRLAHLTTGWIGLVRIVHDNCRSRKRLCLCNLDLPCILTISRYHSSPSHVATYLAFFIAGVVQVVTVHLVESFREESSMSSSSVQSSFPNRWVLAITAFLMQLALASVYAWSVFLIPSIAFYHVSSLH